MTHTRGILDTINQATEFEELSDLLTTLQFEDTILASRVISDGGQAKDTKILWEEDEDTQITVKASEGATITSGDTTITVDHSSAITIGDLIALDFEVARVTAVAGNNLTVTRGFGDSSASTHASNVTIRLIGNALVEGADNQSVNSTTRTKASNEVQIFTNPIAISKSKRWTESPGGKELQIQTVKKMREHKKWLEHATIWGSRNSRAASTPGSMGGLVELITNNRTNQAGTLSKTQLDTFLRSVYDDAGDTDFFLVGSLLFQVINNYPAAGFPAQQGQTGAFGARFEAYIGPFGRLPVMVSRMLRGGDGLALESENLRYKWGQKPVLERLPDTGHAMEWQILSEVSLERRHNKSHGFLFGVTG